MERGEVISHIQDPPIESNVFRGQVFWLGQDPLVVGKKYKLKLGSCETQVEVQSIDSIINIENAQDVLSLSKKGSR